MRIVPIRNTVKFWVLNSGWEVSCARASVYVTEVPSELLSAMGRGVAWRGVAVVKICWQAPAARRASGDACGGIGLRYASLITGTVIYTANVAGWHLPREAGAKRRWAKTQMGRMAVKS